MKTTKSNRKMAPREVSKRAAESLNLSPESLRDRSSTKTEILNAILARDNRSYNLRHWGINE